jgi:hypothetical protein
MAWIFTYGIIVSFRTPLKLEKYKMVGFQVILDIALNLGF